MVLAVWPQTEDFGPMCHIGITPVIMRHAYAWNELSQDSLSILQYQRNIRIDIGKYEFLRLQTCIGIYSNFRVIPVTIIGSIEPERVYPHRLTFEIGDSTDGGFPLCGPIDEKLGIEAVVAWRRINDRERLEAEFEESSHITEAVFERLKAEEREKRMKRKKS